MPSDTLCPDPARVARLMAGDLSAEEINTICDHVTVCTKCTTILRNLPDELAFLQPISLSHATWINDPGDREAIEGLIEQWRDLSIQISPSSEWLSGEDVVEEHHSSASGHARSKTEPDYLEKLLRPPAGAGELGFLGPYRILSVLGVGGMGVVFEGEDPHLKRRVAIKAMQPSLLGLSEHKRRFLREARVAASIEHDHIVPLHHIGEDNGVPYFVMPLLKGESLDATLRREGPLSIQQTLDIGKQIAAGIAAAHAHGLIHRDIKPANIWLEDKGHHIPRVKLLDFGLSRNEEDDSQLTRAGSVAGTPAFMSPEQARGESPDARGDLFSLGSVLYYMLVGRPAFTGRNSAALMYAIMNHQPDFLAMNHLHVPHGLSALIAHLLEKDPELRTQRAQDVVDAFDRISAEYANSPSISVDDSPRPIHLSTLQLTHASDTHNTLQLGQRRLNDRDAMRRIPRSKIIGGVTMIAMILLAPALWIMKVETPHGTIVLKADPQAISGASVSIDDQQTITLGLPESSGPITLQVDPGSHKLRVSKPGFELFTHEFSLLTNDRHEIEVRLEPADSGVANDNNTSSPKPSIDERATDTGPGKPPAILGDSPLPGLVPAPSAIAGHRRWQIETLGLRGDIFAVAWGDQTQIACGSPTGSVRIIDATTSQAKHIFPAHLGSVWAMDWHQTTDQIVTAGEDGAVRLFDSSGRLLRELGTHTGIARCVAFNRDGSWIASGGFDSQVRLWRSTGEPGPVLSGHSAQIDGIAWHPSLKKLASASLDGTVRIWDLNQSWQTSGIVGQQLDGHLGGVLGLTWSFDGRLLASVGVDGSTILWNSDGTRHSVLDVHGSAVTAVACSPLGVVATSGDDKTVRLWRSDGTHLTTQNLDTTRINDLAWSHDGSRLAIATGDHGIRFLNASGQWDGAIELDSLAPRAIAFNPSGDLATVGDDGFIAIWNSDGAQKKRLEGQSGRVRSVAWSPDGNRLISASHEDAVRLWNASDGTNIARTGTAPAAWNPRNDEIAWVSGSEVHVEALGASDRVLRGHQSQVVQLAWNADGSQLASADVSGEIRVWGRDDTPQGLIKTDPSVAALVWHPIKPLLTTGSLANGHVQVWRLDGNLVKSWNAHSKAVIALAWSSIGDRLLSSSFDQSVRVWNQDGDAVASLAGPMSICTGVAWRESDHQIATVHIDGTLCRWNSSTYEPTFKSLIFANRDWVTFNSQGVANLSEPTAADNRLIVIAESESGALTTMKPSEFHNGHEGPSINGR